MERKLKRLWHLTVEPRQSAPRLKSFIFLLYDAVQKKAGAVFCSLSAMHDFFVMHLVLL